MKYSLKAKLGIIAGIGIMVFVVSLFGLPFSDSHNVMQKATQNGLNNVADSESKMLDVIAQEKAELTSKIEKNP